MAKRKQRRPSERTAPTQSRPRKKLSRTAVYRIFALVGLSVALLAVYRFFMTTPYFLTVMVVYMVLGAGSLLGYVVYNRGFSRRGVSAEMLPDSMTEEEKAAFVADAEARTRRSHWLLIVTFAFFFTFAIDLMELYVIPTIGSIFGFGSAS